MGESFGCSVATWGRGLAPKRMKDLWVFLGLGFRVYGVQILCQRENSILQKALAKLVEVLQGSSGSFN